ncbi:hypothetical protein Tco_0693181 [Tanacetum coccineum]
MIVSGQSETLVGQGSACNRDCGHILPFARVLQKCLICVRLEVSGPQPAYPGLSSSSHYRINLSQLSVITAANVSHFENLCRVHNIEPTVGLFRWVYVSSKDKGWMSFSKRPDSDTVCYTKPLDSLKHWNDHFFWVNSFAFSASFLWHTGKNISRDLFPKSTEFNADHYAIIVAHPALFQKFPVPFLCLDGMSRYYTLDDDTYPSFLHDDGTVMNPTKVKVGKREHAEGEAKLLDSTVGRVVLLLPVAPTCVDSELEASIDRLFDEGGSMDHGDSAVGGGQETKSELATGVRIVADENVAVEKPKHPCKKRQAVTDASGSSHPPKKLRGDHETSSRAAIGDKSLYVLKELLASSMLNVEAGIQAVTTLPFATSSVSVTPKHESGVHTDSIAGLNLRTIGASKRLVISSYSSYHSSINAFRAEADSFINYVVVPPVMTEAVITSYVVNAPSVLVPESCTKIPFLVHASMFHDSDFTEMVKADTAGPSYSAKQDLLMGSRELNSETLHQVFVPQWNVLNDSLLDDYDVY